MFVFYIFKKKKYKSKKIYFIIRFGLTAFKMNHNKALKTVLTRYMNHPNQISILNAIPNLIQLNIYFIYIYMLKLHLIFLFHCYSYLQSSIFSHGEK